MVCFLHRFERNVQIGLLVDLCDGDIQRSLAEVCPGRQRRFPDNTPMGTLYRLQTEHRAKLFECNALGPSREAVFRPGVQADRILAAKSDSSRFLGKLSEEAFLAFQLRKTALTKDLFNLDQTTLDFPR